MAAAMLALTACGKEDKLVLVTTEAAASQSDATTTEDILADIREEAENTTEERAIEQEAPTSKSVRFKWREHVTVYSF